MDKEELIEHYNHLDQKRSEISQALEKVNEIKKAEIKKKGEIVNFYTCQKCRREFITDKEFKIIQGKEPICIYCEKDINEYTYLNKDIPIDIIE